MTSAARGNEPIAITFDCDNNVATLTLQMPGGVNVIDDVFFDALEAALDWLGPRESLAGVIVDSAYRDFCVGANLDSLWPESDAPALMVRVRRIQQLLRRLETCRVPTVALLNGSVVGGGYELALACHRRIAVDDPRLRIGLPETKLGLIPGAGGTQRLPRLVGFGCALDLLVRGTTLSVRDASEQGLVDEVCASAAAARSAAERWIARHRNAGQPWDKPGYRFPPPAPDSPAARDLFLAASAKLYQKTAGSLAAPQAAISAVYEGAPLTLERALEVEMRYFVEAALSGQCKDMIRTLWYHRRAAEKHQDLPHADDAQVTKVGILGAGMMGAGLAFACAAAGYRVAVRDVAQPVLDAARRRCERLAAQQAERRGEKEPAAILERIELTLDPDALAGSHLIIEAISEDLALKQRVMGELRPMLDEGGIWASNTSALPIDTLAAALPQPERVIGLHFFSPVERMPLLEVIKGRRTSETTVARALAFARRLRKTPILVNDRYGFYTTRVFLAYVLEGAQLVAEGHHPALVEWAARSAGMAVGPLQVLDEIGLELARHILDGAPAHLGHALEAPGAALVERMLDEAGRRGKAAGAGFYAYTDGKRQGLWPGLAGLAGATPHESDAAALGERLLLIQCIEAVRALEEGTIERHRDADLGAILGVGFAQGTGGPLSHLDRLGIPEACARLGALASEHGARYAPPQRLVAMARDGQRFYVEAT